MPTYDELKAMPPDEVKTAIDDVIADNMSQVCEDSAFCDCMAGTNADNWGIDDYELDEPVFDDANKVVRVPVTYDASGDQIEDKGFCGTEISGTATLVIHSNGNVEVDDVRAELSGLD